MPDLEEYPETIFTGLLSKSGGRDRRSEDGWSHTFRKAGNDSGRFCCTSSLAWLLGQPLQLLASATGRPGDPKSRTSPHPSNDESKHMQNDADEPCLVVIRRAWSQSKIVTYVRLVDPFTRYRQGSRLPVNGRTGTDDCLVLLVL